MFKFSHTQKAKLTSCVVCVLPLQKKKEREAAILKNSKLTPDQREKWLSIAKNEYMSSEESGDEDYIVVHPLPWKSEYVNKMFEKIDAYVKSKKSLQARRQMKNRRIGCPSSRLRPINGVPEWALR